MKVLKSSILFENMISIYEYQFQLNNDRNTYLAYFK